MQRLLLKRGLQRSWALITTIPILISRIDAHWRARVLQFSKTSTQWVSVFSTPRIPARDIGAIGVHGPRETKRAFAHIMAHSGGKCQIVRAMLRWTNFNTSICSPTMRTALSPTSSKLKGLSLDRLVKSGVK